MASSQQPPEEQSSKAQNAAASDAPQDSSGANRSAPPADNATVPPPAVRFSSAVEEIAPGPAPVTPAADKELTTPPPNVSADELKQFTESLKDHKERPALQQHRMNTFQFEPFSLPASRVPSRDDESSDTSRLPTPSSQTFPRSPGASPRLNPMNQITSPPLTPSGSDPTQASERKQSDNRSLNPNDPQAITPQASTSNERSPNIAGHRQTLTHRPASSDHVLQRASSLEERQEASRSHRRGMFGQGGSVPVSRESSPSRSAASNFYSKPMTPGGDANDPYAKGRRPAQQSSRHQIDPRFVFSRKKKKGTPSPSSSKTSLTEKRSSGLFAKAGDDLGQSDSASTGGHHHDRQGSMSDLKRFFKGGHKHKHKHKNDKKSRESSPAPASRTSTKTPPASRSTQQLPFGDDHGLSTKYGKIGRVLGSGAGGSVKLMKRKEDNTVFAVKEFRAKHYYETEKEYNKKVTAEFCVGSTLHHGNIIETLDIVHEKGRWYEVMEYAPYDLFATVMTGKMSREEIRCCFLQILNGVTYLHSLGLAHRDLKLDNVVISEQGIMKIIDFGSAHVFKYPFETDIVMAKGIVGSDPYLAPEVYTAKEYDASAADIWSLAIIFCCMTLRRFPWKIPQNTDNSWKLFAAEPTPGHDPAKLVHPAKRPVDPSVDAKEEEKKKENHQAHKRHESTATVDANEAAKEKEGSSQSPAPDSNSQQSGEKKEVIRGPWRILRLLPRGSRYIIWRMLDINPRTRATMDEILAELWVADSLMCQQTDNGEVIHAEDHQHVLQPPSNPTSAT